MRVHLTLLILASAVLGVACTSTPEDEGSSAPSLPFHVAILPVEELELRAPDLAPTGEATDMRLALDADGVATALEAQLGGGTFTRVSRLPAGADPVAAGRAERADLLLEVSLRYAEPIWRERLVSGWTNFLLFALGGPFVTRQRDFAYHAEAELQASLYELGAIDGVRVRLGDSRARVFLSEARFEGVPLSYNERREGSSGWWKALFVPSGFLAKQSPALEQNLAAAVPTSLAEDLAADVRRESASLLDRGPLGGFALDVESVTAERESDGFLRVRGAVLVPTGSRFERMRRVRLLLGEALGEEDFGEGTPDPRGQRFDFSTRVREAGRWLTIELEAGSRDPLVRSYCFDVDELLAPAS